MVVRPTTVARKPAAVPADWRHILIIFVAMKDHELGASAMRGAGGPLRVNDQLKGNKLHEVVMAAAGQAGSALSSIPTTRRTVASVISRAPSLTAGG